MICISPLIASIMINIYYLHQHIYSLFPKMKLFPIQTVFKISWLHNFVVGGHIFNWHITWLSKHLFYVFMISVLLSDLETDLPEVCVSRAQQRCPNPPSRWRHLLQWALKGTTQNVSPQQALTFRGKQSICKRGKLNEQFPTGMVVSHSFT